MWIDAHAHLCAPELACDLEALLERAQAAGIEAVINICTEAPELEKGIELKKRYPWIYNVASTTPHDAETIGERDFEMFAKEAHAGSLVAIGETGLDYFHFPKSAAPHQQALLRRFLRLARETSLPVVIHCREAFADFFSILDELPVEGVLHCFTGTLEEAKELLKRGWYLSFSGIVTYKKSESLREILKHVPLDRLLIETDAPYLAPQKFRGHRNEPAFLLDTAATIAEVRGISLEELSSITCVNTKRFFRINRVK